MGDIRANLDEHSFDLVKQKAEKIKQYPIYYVDAPGTVEEIYYTILEFRKKFSDKWLIVTLDHTLLVRGKSAEAERITLSNLQRMLLKVKKFHMTTIIQITQMNRNIESPERINNVYLHFPMRSDISGSDSIFQASDLIIVIHRPEILGIAEYGINKWETKGRIFLHIIKNREGEPTILGFYNNLKYGSIDETPS